MGCIDACCLMQKKLNLLFSFIFSVDFAARVKFSGRRAAEAPRGAWRCHEATRNTLGCGGGLSTAGKARRCVPPPGAPAGGEQQGTGSQHARDADTAQRDEHRAPGGALWPDVTHT